MDKYIGLGYKGKLQRLVDNRVTIGHTPLAPFFIRGYGSKSIMFEGQWVGLGPLFTIGQEGDLLKH